MAFELFVAWVYAAFSLSFLAFAWWLFYGNFDRFKLHIFLFAGSVVCLLLAYGNLIAEGGFRGVGL